MSAGAKGSLPGSSSGVVRLVVAGVLVAVAAGGGTAYLLTRGGGGSGGPPAGLTEEETGEQAGQPQEEVQEEPPLSEARVEGTFKGKGLHGAELTFVPQCASGPCTLRAMGKRPEFLLAQPEGADFGALGARTKGAPVLYVSKRPRIPVRLEFDFDGASYRSQLRLRQDCSIIGFKVPMSVTFAFEVSRAELIDGVWRATELTAATKLRTGKTVFDQSDTDYPGFVEFEFTCLPVRDRSSGTLSLQT